MALLLLLLFSRKQLRFERFLQLRLRQPPLRQPSGRPRTVRQPPGTSENHAKNPRGRRTRGLHRWHTVPNVLEKLLVAAPGDPPIAAAAVSFCVAIIGSQPPPLRIV